jgi:lysophospholipase L1-like esterase
MNSSWRPAFRLTARVLVLLALVAAAACDNNDSPTEPTPPPNPNEVFYTAIGASDGVGFGSTAPCLPFADCPDGTGYVQLTARRLRADGKIVEVTNLSIPGHVLSRNIQDIGNSVGRPVDGNMIDRMMGFVPRNSTLVTIFAGGNDANVIGEAVARGQGGTDPAAYIATQVNNYGRDIRALYSGVRERAPNTLVGQGALVIDLMCDARSYQAGNYSSDGFHPNDAGYAYMHALIYPIALTGSAPPPSASCAPMTMF